MTKLALSSVGSLIDATTAGNTINTNFQSVAAAFDNTLSRDGTSPNPMVSNLDMNSNQILNLPAPVGANSPIRLTDLNSIISGGNIIINGATSVGLALPTDFTVTNSPVTTTGTLTGAWATPPTGTGAVVRATSPTIVTPTISGALTGTGAIKSSSSSGGVGYSTAVGAGAAITQLTNRTTGVTINTVTGGITLFTAAGSATAASFTVTNSSVAATDTIIVNQQSGTNLYNTHVTAVAAGSFRITFFTTGGTASDTPVFNFSVIKGSAN